MRKTKTINIRLLPSDYNFLKKYSHTEKTTITKVIEDHISELRSTYNKKKLKKKEEVQHKNGTISQVWDYE